MDITTARIIIMLLSFAAFIGIVLWAWSSKRRKRFEEAAHLPFADEDMHRRTLERQRRQKRHRDKSRQPSSEHPDTERSP